MPYLSREQIEGIAARVVDAYWKLTSQSSTEKRICRKSSRKSSWA